MPSATTLVAALGLAAFGCRAWVLPGTAPMQYNEGEPVELKVNKLTSPKTHLGFEHYSLAFCRVRLRARLEQCQ
jgi:transmembrane 9 superfamily protein 2/4